jgi:SP family arabinose:H+ symporter-like MFS transporter
MTRALNGVLLRSVIVAALGGALLGFDTAVISGATHSLTLVFGLTPVQLGLTVSSALWGTVIGAIAAGPMGRRLGGRSSLLILAMCYLVSALGCAFALNWPMFLVFRIIGGVGIGGSSVIAPVYIAEISPSAWRGRLVGTFQINTVAGIVLAYLSNYLLGLAMLGNLEWRWQLGVAAIPAEIFFLLTLRNPQSARWLTMKGRLEEARHVLSTMGSADSAAELATITAGLREEGNAQTDRLFRWKYRRPIMLALLIAMFNQLTGINAVLYYLNDIFGAAGFDRTSQNLQAVTVGGTMLIATTVALTMIDKLGRKTLLIAGSAGLALCLAGIAAIFHYHSHQSFLLPLVVAYVAFFSFSQGAVIWVYLSEIFPSHVRAQGQSLGSSTHWVMNAAISGLFPLIAARSQEGPFVLFMVMMILQVFTVWLFFPETSGVTLEEMHRRVGVTRVDNVDCT